MVLSGLYQTEVKGQGYGFPVEMLTDEDQFLHTVAVTVIPVTFEVGVLRLELPEFIRWHRSIPRSGIA